MQLTKFKLPIEYNDGVRETSPSLISDLELVSTEEAPGLYKRISPVDPLFPRIEKQLAGCFTNNVDFLKDSQALAKEGMSDTGLSVEEGKAMNELRAMIAEEDAFFDKYMYVEWGPLQFLNSNPKFLQILGLFNIGSPVLTLALPIIMMLAPFLIIKLQGHNVSITKYLEVLRLVFSRHSIGQLFSIGTVDWDKRIYILFSVALYAMQIYQNAMACRRFIKNMDVIDSQLSTMDAYLARTISVMEDCSKRCKKLNTYKQFAQDVDSHIKPLRDMREEIDRLTVLGRSKLSMGRASEMGGLLRCFYRMYNDQDFLASLDYSLSLHAYVSFMNAVSMQIGQGRLAACSFSKKNTEFKEAYFLGTDCKGDPVTNSYKLDKNIVITGPNAAGKTTVLKGTLFNVLISQQAGVGCYKKAKINPYDHLHSYLNIPDTSGRDSLFQAEARRCKEILQAVSDNAKPVRHLCIFDELYSGTNPYEAIASATAFLGYMNRMPGFTYLLTTHFTLLCKLLGESRKLENKHMVANHHEQSIQYTYKLKSGISALKGGVSVLQGLGYPEEIVEKARSVLEEVDL
jgi:hypothetical protein